jgi:hypothetical protein
LVLSEDIKVSTDRLEREYKRSSLDAFPSVTGKRWAELTFKTELKYATSGSVYTPLDTMFKACGLSSSFANGTASYSPISDAPANMIGPATSCTIVVNKDGLQHSITGSVGSWKLVAEAGKFGEIEFTFKGMYNSVADVSNPVVTLNTTAPPIAQLAQLHMDNFVPVAGKIEVDAANDVQGIDDINSLNAMYGFMIVNRKPVGTFDPMATSVANYDFFGKLISGVTATGSFHLSTGSPGGTVEFNFPQVQYTDMAYADKNGLLTFNVPLKFAGTGDDWVNIRMY